jgi:hypothetical protein
VILDETLTAGGLFDWVSGGRKNFSKTGSPIISASSHDPTLMVLPTVPPCGTQYSAFSSATHITAPHHAHRARRAPRTGRHRIAHPEHLLIGTFLSLLPFLQESTALTLHATRSLPPPPSGTSVFTTSNNTIGFENRASLMKGDRLAEGIQTVEIPISLSGLTHRVDQCKASISKRGAGGGTRCALARAIILLFVYPGYESIGSCLPR